MWNIAIISEIHTTCCDVLRIFSAIPCGVEACIAAGAVALLVNLMGVYGDVEAEEAL